MVPLCLLWAGACPSEKQKDETLHPKWDQLNEPEDKFPENQCIFTKFGAEGFRLHVTHQQQPFNTRDCFKQFEKNIIHTDQNVNSWVVTPHFYGSVTEEKFPKTMQAGMRYRFDKDDTADGIPLSFLEEWLAIDSAIDPKEAILIVSTGIEGKLGVSDALKKALKDKQDQGAIKAYYIVRSKEAVRLHNRCVKEGETVFTFIHMAG
ncbi:MAG: hypothetical protein V3581_02330 [Candidatus Cardinium sp.]|uniref:hypothetical protein n=1 Tax=Candidatus Cardinium sp. TP TaxID=2961955 RepID=UPI0021AE36A9|nr:hypothetical protein [Candidatus Cardinium sp. TP]MCT4697406.1 hypothetical protein [Candidatus Cardinium sp. TP]MDN5247068.1 hypothetical protein [Candidatus Cardinium sp.]